MGRHRTCSEATDMPSVSTPMIDEEPSLKSHVRTSSMSRPSASGTRPRCTAAKVTPPYQRWTVLDDVYLLANAFIGRQHANSYILRKSSDAS